MPSISELPRHRLWDGPSPLQRLPRLTAALGGHTELWVKREDLLPVAFGGNKLRNLEFLVGAALAQGADSLITSGRRWSNHCRLTAAAGARAGLEVDLVLTGPVPEAAGANVALEGLLGARVHVTATDNRAEREALVEQIALERRGAGRRPYIIAVGGSGAIGAAGQVLAAAELAEQASVAGFKPDAVVLPSATGGTQAGLIAGLRSVGLGTRVLGVVVARPAEELRVVIAALLAELAGFSLTAAGASGTGGRALPDEIVELDERQLGAGYGRPSDAGDEATALLARTEGIFVDPVYTAKALAALIAAVRRGELDGQQVVFWHAGGTPGLFETLGP
jgi:1-aminocyclopropane-1-carboxylate deaminase/D-cysteine desulfhydrase-like pyridoxal-dependent ACC family enzyme